MTRECNSDVMMHLKYGKEDKAASGFSSLSVASSMNGEDPVSPNLPVPSRIRICDFLN
jgi:hypothetical protein